LLAKTFIMAKMYSTPGVYIEEKDAFSRSVVPVATAVPCFVGCTQKATRDNEPVKKKLVKVKSFEEFIRFFGEGPTNTFQVSEEDGAFNIIPNPDGNNFYLYNAIKFFYANGGGDCYIFSIGDYSSGTPIADDFSAVIKPLENEPEPTIIVMPDAHLIKSSADYYSIWQKVLPHCKKMINRFAILDIHNEGEFGDVSNPLKADQLIDKFKQGIGTKELAYGAVYWPWVQSTVVSPRDINYKNISNWKEGVDIGGNTQDSIMEVVKQDLTVKVNKMSESQFAEFFGPFPAPVEIGLIGASADIKTPAPDKDIVINSAKLLKPNDEGEGVKFLIEQKAAAAAASFDEITELGADFNSTEFAKAFEAQPKGAFKPYKEYFETIGGLKDLLASDTLTFDGEFKDADGNVVESENGLKLVAKINGAIKEIKNLPTKIEFAPLDEQQQHEALMQLSPKYKSIINKVRDTANVMPASAGMAGLYKYVDSDRGTFQSPANISISSVAKPLLTINDEGQENLNIPIDGKAINVIRTFPGKGTLVWGARTMDGNSQDWRYISVRRTVSMIELSVKYAAEAYVFEPNNASTWSNIQSMISNFLTNMWQGGALAGTTAAEAFSVSVGLGSTMTPVDILDGYMNISVKVAVTRPAEFIVITFQQQMQTS